MSIAAMNWAWAIKMPPNAKLYLLTLADRADGAGHCFPSIGDSAKRTGLSRDGRVDGGVVAPIPHSPGCAEFPLPVLHERGSLAEA